MHKTFKFILVILCLSQISYAGDDRDGQNQTLCSSFTKLLSKGATQAKNHLSFLLMPAENPTWGSTLYKASVGIGLSLTGGMIEAYQQIDIDSSGRATSTTDSPQATCYFFSANLLFGAAGDAMHIIYNYLLSPTPEMIQKTKREIYNKKKINLTDEKVRNLFSEKRKHNQAYITRIGQYLFNSAGMAHGIYLYCYLFNSFLKDGTNPFALSFPEGYPDCESLTILCRPVTTPVFLTLYTATLLYNLRELSFCIDPASFVERGDIPFFSFINAFGKIGFSKTMTGRWGGVNMTELEKLAFHKKAYEQEINNRYGVSIPKLREFAEGFLILEANNQLDRNAENYYGMQKVTQSYLNYLETAERYDNYVATHKHHLSGLNWFLPAFLRYYGNYQLYESSLLTLKNVICYFKDLPIIDVLDDQLQSTQHHVPEILQGKKEKPKTSRKITIEEDEKPFLSLLPQTGKESFGKEKTQDYQDPLPKVKIKKRGIPNLNLTTPSQQSTSKQKTSNLPTDSKADLRKEGLDNVQALRDQYPVKECAIQNAIKDLEKFLNGNSETIQGSEYRLVWHINGKRYAMKYETPHGWDGSNFAGNKLNRILNVLEVGYLIGLNEDQITAYVKENDRWNLLRFPKFIRFLALNPAK